MRGVSISKCAGGPFGWLALFIGLSSASAAAVVIDAQPVSVTVTAGAPAAFTVGASGAGTLAYQWRRHGFAIPGATAATLSLAAATRSQSDYYDVVVTDTDGSAESAKVKLGARPMAYPEIVRFDPDSAVIVEDLNAASSISGLALTADGKTIAVGSFATVAGRRRTMVVRFNADNTIDETFVPPRILGSLIYKAVVQPDGKLLLAGYSLVVNGKPAVSLIRLNPDGSLDAGFTLDLQFGSFQIASLAVRADGKIWVGGSSYAPLVRLNPDGSADGSFPPYRFPNTDSSDSVAALVPLANGGLLAGGKTLRRLKSDGTLDSTFNAPVSGFGGVSSIVLQPDGKILVGGWGFATFGPDRLRIARLNTDGTLDQSFRADIGYYNESTVTDLALQEDGRMVVTGNLSSSQGGPKFYAARLNADGTRDATFVPDIQGSVDSDSQVRVYAVLLRPDHTVVIGGGFTKVNGLARSRLTVMNADGTLNAALADAIRGVGSVGAMAAAPGGGVYVAGTFTHLNGQPRNSIALLGADGAIDPNFNPDVTGPRDIGFPTQAVNALLVQGDEKILLGGYFDQVGWAVHKSIARLNADGSVDAGFAGSIEGTQGRVFAMALQFDRKVVVGGYFLTVSGVSRSALARLNEDGTLDTAFTTRVENPPGAGQTLSLAIQPDGKLLVGGQFTKIGGVARANLARINTDGSVDASFIPAIPTYPAVRALVAQPDRQLLVAVDGVVRLNSDGSADTAFGPAFPSVSAVQTLLREEDGQIRVGGQFAGRASAPLTQNLLRLKADGTLDSNAAFEPGNCDLTSVNALLLTDAGELWLGGTESGGSSLARLVSTPGPVFSVQPRSQSVAATGTVTFAAAAMGSSAPTYQWLFNGVPLSGATEATLTLTAISSADAGSYQVVASNGADSLGSSVVTLTVRSAVAPTITVQPQARAVAVGDFVQYTLRARGDPAPSFRWERQAAGTTGFVDLSQSGSSSGYYVSDGDPATLFFFNLTLAMSGDQFRCVVSNGAGSVTSEVVTLTVDPPLAITSSASAYFGVGVAGSFPIVGTGVPLPTLRITGDLPAGMSFAADAAGGRATIGGTATSAAGSPFVVTVYASKSSGQTVTQSLTINVGEVPTVLTQPCSQLLMAGGTMTLSVNASSASGLSYQWRKDGVDLVGATAAQLVRANVQAADAGEYAVVVSNPYGSVSRALAHVAVLPAGTPATQTLAGMTVGATPTVTIANTFTYAGPSPGLTWRLLLPAGWSLASSVGDDGAVKPAPGTTELLEWSWTSAGASPANFSYTLNAPDAATAEHEIVAMVTVQAGTDSLSRLAQPDPLPIRFRHSADTNQDGKLSLAELLRVIELYNTRNGTTRTGRYTVLAGTEDGFTTDPLTANNATVSLAAHHSGDTNRDGKLSLTELLRVIELYNTRSGTTRTGQYHLLRTGESASEDGFAIGP